MSRLYVALSIDLTQRSCTYNESFSLLHFLRYKIKMSFSKGKMSHLYLTSLIKNLYLSFQVYARFWELMRCFLIRTMSFFFIAIAEIQIKNSFPKWKKSHLSLNSLINNLHKNFQICVRFWELMRCFLVSSFSQQFDQISS